jgi:hypothetical protein
MPSQSSQAVSASPSLVPTASPSPTAPPVCIPMPSLSQESLPLFYFAALPSNIWAAESPSQASGVNASSNSHEETLSEMLDAMNIAIRARLSSRRHSTRSKPFARFTAGSVAAEVCLTSAFSNQTNVTRARSASGCLSGLNALARASSAIAAALNTAQENFTFSAPFADDLGYYWSEALLASPLVRAVDARMLSPAELDHAAAIFVHAPFSEFFKSQRGDFPAADQVSRIKRLLPALERFVPTLWTCPHKHVFFFGRVASNLNWHESFPGYEITELARAVMQSPPIPNATLATIEHALWSTLPARQVTLPYPNAVRSKAKVPCPAQWPLAHPHWGRKEVIARARIGEWKRHKRAVKCDPLSSSGVLHSMPRPGCSAADADDAVSLTRPLLAVFLGNGRGPTHPRALAINALEDCASETGDCLALSVWHKKTPNLSMIYAAARFCLHPPGDTPTRKALFDSMTQGCVPVIVAPALGNFIDSTIAGRPFDLASSTPGAEDYVLPWNDMLIALPLTTWKTPGALIAALRSVSAARLRAMQLTLASAARLVTFSSQSGSGSSGNNTDDTLAAGRCACDSIDVLLARLARGILNAPLKT